MNAPVVASVLVVLGIWGLFWLVREPSARASRAIWLPVIWLGLSCSRMLGSWLATGSRGNTITANRIDAIAEGNPTDRFFLTALLLLGIVVLIGRKRQVGRLLHANAPIVVFFLYCAVSVIWSDYPIITLKRWVRSIGDPVMVLIVATEANVTAAAKQLLARVGIALVPVSILLIKYYPSVGRQYNRWTGEQMVTGVCPDKNLLGLLCLVIGLAFLWRLLESYRDRENSFRRRHMIANGAMLAMTVSLLWKSNSMTSLLCFLASGTVILLASCTWIVRRPVVLHLLLAGFVLALCAVYVFNLDEVILKMVGRSPTFTGRTDMWKVFLKIAGNPWVGTGFQSFWLGERMQKVLRAFPEHWYNQAHNGYLEVFLNLGWIGVVLLALLLAHGYRRIVAAYRTSPYIGSLWLGYFVAALLENFTEAEFRLMSPVWIMSLLAIVWASAARDSEERVGENSSLINMQSWYISSPTWARTSGPAGETVKVSHSWKCPVAHHR